jgi:hypothetical protein
VFVVMAKICPTCSRMHSGPAAHCPTHETERRRIDNVRLAAKATAHGRRTKHWVTLRAQRLELDAHTCQRCHGTECGNKNMTVHLDPRLGGDHSAATIDDVTSLGRYCHGIVDGGRSRRKGGVAGRRTPEQSPVPKFTRTET